MNIKIDLKTQKHENIDEDFSKIEIHSEKIMPRPEVEHRLREFEAIELVEDNHFNKEDLYDGDLLERVSHSSPYELKKININDIDLEEWNSDKELIEEYMEEIDMEIESMPIPLISKYMSIIDGTHRLNALEQLGYEKVWVYIGKN